MKSLTLILIFISISSVCKGKIIKMIQIDLLHFYLIFQEKILLEDWQIGDVGDWKELLNHVKPLSQMYSVQEIINQSFLCINLAMNCK